jgi:hypothetical protein
MKTAGLLIALLVLGSQPASAATALFSLAIGYNGVPASGGVAGAGELSFADDDALAVHALARTIARRSLVLTLPDRATQTRFESSGEARPPSIAELRRVLAEMQADIRAAVRAGDEVSVWFYYSGHGWLDDRGRANLTLADGALSQELLYEEILPALRGQAVHLMIDACHAEALIRQRDVTAQTVELSPSEVASASLRRRLDQLPDVGVIMASASNTQAHEWDDYQTGVFTHELLSGLRGGADVNGDGRVEYSELAAFLAAANRQISDPRGRLTTLVVAPKLYPRAAIVDTRAARATAHLQGLAHHLGRFQIDDPRGNRLLDLRTEPGFVVDLVVPAGERLLVGNETHEASVLVSLDRPTNLEDLVLEDRPVRARGVVAESMRRGLFGAEFGPSYYRGFVDSSDSKMVPVDLSPVGTHVSAGAASRPGTRYAAWSAFGVGGAFLVTAGVFAILASQARADFDNTDLERPSIDAHARYERYGGLALGATTAAIASTVLGYWLWNRDTARKDDRR